MDQHLNKKNFHQPSISTIPETRFLVEETPTMSRDDVSLHLLPIPTLSLVGENITVAKQQFEMVLPKVCGITLSTITLRCFPPPF